MNDRQEDDSMSYSGDRKEGLEIKRFVMKKKESHKEREIRGRTKQEWTSQGEKEVKNEQEIRCQIYTKHLGTKHRQPDIAGKVGSDARERSRQLRQDIRYAEIAP